MITKLHKRTDHDGLFKESSPYGEKEGIQFYIRHVANEQTHGYFIWAIINEVRIVTPLYTKFRSEELEDPEVYWPLNSLVNIFTTEVKNREEYLKHINDLQEKSPAFDKA